MLISHYFERLENYNPVLVLTSNQDCEIMSLQIVVQSRFLHILCIQDRATLFKRDVNIVHMYMQSNKTHKVF